jgi:hypothetical protein
MFSMVFERHGKAVPQGTEAAFRCVRPPVHPQPAPAPCNTVSCADHRQAAQLRRGPARDHARRRAWAAQMPQQSGGEFAPTDTTTRADHEAVQVAAAGAAASLYPRSDRQCFLPPSQPRHRRQVSHRSQPGICHLGRDHRRGNGGLIAPPDNRHRTQRAFGFPSMTS